MKVLVTGGAGFIGSHLVDKLVSLGYETAVVDDLSTGSPLFLNKEAVFYEVSITEQEKLFKIFKEWKPEIVFHLAAKTDVSSSVENPLEDARVNIYGFLNTLLASKEAGIKKFIFTSSAAVYGTPRYVPVDEEHPIYPLSPYGTSKAAAEWYLSSFFGSDGFDYTILRLANVYGPRQGVKVSSGIISILIQSFLKGKNVTLYDPDSTSRDYVYVEDVVKALVLAIEHGSKETLNISSGIETKTMEVLEKVLSLVSGKFEIQPLRRGEIKRIYLSNLRAKNVLGWEPKTALDEGIKKTYEFFKNWR